MAVRITPSAMNPPEAPASGQPARGTASAQIPSVAGDYTTAPSSVPQAPDLTGRRLGMSLLTRELKGFNFGLDFLAEVSDAQPVAGYEPGDHSAMEDPALNGQFTVADTKRLLGYLRQV